MNKTMHGARPFGWLIAAVVGMSLLQGCASKSHPDPLEGMNRKVFAFNESLDNVVLKPVATGFNSIAPQPLKTAISNFSGNLRDVWSGMNLVLQGHPGDASLVFMRVGVNTTFGLAGLIDIATPMRLEKRTEDFGQTLGVWGVKPGAYIVWPLLGPSTLRDSVGIPGEMYFSPGTVMGSTSDAYAATVVNVINARASLLDATNLLSDVALDKYAFVRDAYLQRRQNLIYNGEPPEEPDEEQDMPPADSAQSAAD